MSKKEYKVTKKVKRAFLIYVAYERLKESYIKQDKHERARRVAIDSQIARDKMWEAIYELYPKLKKVECNYDPIKGVILEGFK